MPYALIASCAVAILLLLAPPVHAAKRCNGENLRPGTANAQRAVGATLCLINRERTKHGRKRLRHNRTLHDEATRYAKQMVRQSFFAHVEPDGDDLIARIRRTGYLDHSRSWSLGENIAWGSGSYATPKQTVRGWMKSPGHRRNILSRSFAEIGIGIAIGAPVADGRHDGATYATNFGRRK